MRELHRRLTRAERLTTPQSEELDDTIRLAAEMLRRWSANPGQWLDHADALECQTLAMQIECGEYDSLGEIVQAMPPEAFKLLGDFLSEWRQLVDSGALVEHAL